MVGVGGGGECGGELEGGGNRGKVVKVRVGGGVDGGKGVAGVGGGGAPVRGAKDLSC